VTLRGQRLPLLGGEPAGGEHPLVRGLGRIVALEDLAPDPPFAEQLTDGAEEVVLEPEQGVKALEDRPGGAGGVAVVADEATHEEAVTLLDPGLVVLAIGPAPGETDPVVPAPAQQAGVDELAAIVEYEGMRKREATSPPRSGYPFSRLPRHEGGAHMPDDRCRLGSDDVVIGLDLASAEHQVVVLTAAGQRLTRFRIPHSRVGLEELLRRTAPTALGRAGGTRVFAFEATGHVWEAVAYILRARGERYMVVNPLTTFRVREARQLSREKTDVTDAEQIGELCRTGLVTRTQLEARPYLALRRAWGEYRRLREERARLKVLVAHQLYGLFPEFLRVWADLLQPGALAVLRTGLTPAAMAALSLSEFVAQVRAHRAGRRIWRFKLAQVHRYAAQTIACPDGLDVLAREVQRAVARIDVLTAQMTAVATEIDALLADLEEVPYLRTIPGLGWASVAGLLAHVGAITKYRHGRQLIKLAGTNPSRRDTGQTVGRGQRMSRRGRSGLREVLYLATISCLQHNPRIRAHYDRLIQRADRPLPKMQALGACMNKLLLYAFAVMSRREAFQLDHNWQRTLPRVA
jgi:transposase